MLVIGIPVIAVAAILFFVLPRSTSTEQANELEEQTKGRSNIDVVQSVISSAPGQAVEVAAVPSTGFATPIRLGFTSGEQWEPAIAADGFGHLYALYMQYQGVPGCATCPSPTMILLVSNDRGTTWSAPRPIAPPGSGQWDPQITVDPLDHRTVYASWLQNNKSDTVVARSTDFGSHWTTVVANSTNAGSDKPILAVRGQDVYVGYNHAQKVWVSASHDGGATFTSYTVNKNNVYGWSLAGGGTVDPAGDVFFAWAGYTQNGGAKGPVNLYISKSSDGGQTWTSTQLDTSAPPPDCSLAGCGWAFLGAQMTMTSNPDGTFYALWNSGKVSQGPERIYFASSSDAGADWSTKQDVSLAPAGVEHAFPAVAAASGGDVRISWMDTRASGLWNVYERSSTDGGVSWSAEVRVSTYVAGAGLPSYITPNGFAFPYGDYDEMEIDDQGTTHIIWGAGESYSGTGSVWYSRGR